VEDTLAAIETGQVEVSDLPLILVVSVGDELYSLNNRRLWVFKQLRARGFLETVRARVRPSPSSPRLAARFTPERCALEASFMRIVTSRRSDDERDARNADGEDVDAEEVPLEQH